MGLEKRIVPDEHHNELLKMKPGETVLFNSKSEAESAANNDSWVAVKGDGEGKPIDTPQGGPFCAPI